MGERVGYIQGAGDNVATCITKMGYRVDELSKADMRENILSQYDAIVIGVRAYNVLDWLTDVHPLLIQYVNQGGVVLVQYNTSSQTGSLKNKIFPYPLTITRNRVSEEAAKVEILEKNHPVFNYPNRISAEDFNGWLQERSLYEVKAKDTTFISLLSMHDKDEEAMTGSLLVSEIGKGRIIYTSLSFFRQLPEGVPGAYRLLANLLAWP
jgi:hypothetical protein